MCFCIVKSNTQVSVLHAFTSVLTRFFIGQNSLPTVLSKSAKRAYYTHVNSYVLHPIRIMIEDIDLLGELFHMSILALFHL